MSERAVLPCLILALHALAADGSNVRPPSPKMRATYLLTHSSFASSPSSRLSATRQLGFPPEGSLTTAV